MIGNFFFGSLTLLKPLKKKKIDEAAVEVYVALVRIVKLSHEKT